MGWARGAGPTFTLEAAAAVAARVDPGRVALAECPTPRPAVGFHHPQVAAICRQNLWRGGDASPAGLSSLIPSLCGPPGPCSDPALVSPVMDED